MERKEVVKDALAGAAAGLAATWVMGRLMAGVSRRLQAALPREEFERRMMQTPEGQKPTAAAAERIAGRDLPPETEDVAASFVHYGLGASLGVLYALLARRAPAVGAGAGLAYGTGVWVGADLVALPALKLSRTPAEYPPSTHAFAAFAHWAYGAVLHRGLQLLRR